jgi:hypothetical protein
MAFQDFFDDVQKLYIAYYQRPADPGGLRFWAQRLEAAGGSLAGIIDAFATSAEATALYGTIDASTIGNVIDSIYQALFGRAPDAAGKQFYIDGFTSGRFTAGSIALDILNGARNEDAVAIQNKLIVADRFTSAVDGRPLTDPDFGTGTSFAATYAGDADAQAARAFLATVTSNPATVPSQAQVIQEIQTHIADPGDPILSASSGQTFTLTPGADNITGTSGNDVINALTVNASGNPATTLSAFDSIDGAGGSDTLNIYSDTTGSTIATKYNAVLPASATIKNVETINIFADAGGSASFSTGNLGDGLIDASKFAGATTIHQSGLASDVINLAAGVTAKFSQMDISSFPISNEVQVAAATGVNSVNIVLAGVGDGDSGVEQWIQIGGDALNTVNVSGSLGTKEKQVGLDIFAGKNQQTITLNTSVGAKVYLYDDSYGSASWGQSSNAVGGNGGTKPVTTLDASASTGDITFNGISYGSPNTYLSTIKTGSGNDDVKVKTATVQDNPLTPVDETVSAVVQTNAGNDKITVLTTGTGATTIDAGAGDDTVDLQTLGTGNLTVNLGKGNDTFTQTTGTAQVFATDVIDGGDGTDTLLLALVGAANVGAFKNFEVFDAVGLGKTLDADILATKNTVTEFVASGDVGAGAALTNIGAGVGFRATADMGGTHTLSLTQKTAGALTVTLDSDSTDDATQNDNTMKVDATNATSLKAVFAADSAFVQTSTIKNDQLMDLTGLKATTLEVVSGGTNATNALTFHAGNSSGTGLLTGITVTGDQALTLDVDLTGVTTNKLTVIDASGMTGGGLTTNTLYLANGGTIKLGAGVDMITVDSSSDATDITKIESLQGYSKGSSTSYGDELAFDLDSNGTADSVTVVSTASTGTGWAVSNKGIVTFTGAGPANLANALTLANLAAGTTLGSAVAFEYIGNTYVFVEGDGNNTVGAGDVVVKLVGVTGVTSLNEISTTDVLYLA